jgi:hypothetical protein
MPASMGVGGKSDGTGGKSSGTPHAFFDGLERGAEFASALGHWA